MVMVSGGGKSITTPQEGTTEGCFVVWDVRSWNNQRSILHSHIPGRSPVLLQCP